MSFRITRALPLLGLLALLASPAAAQKAKPVKGEPSYDGRPLSSWIEDLSGLAPYTRHSAAYAIADMGPKATAAVPALMKNLEDPEPTVRYPSASVRATATRSGVGSRTRPRPDLRTRSGA